jgi:hypothetical protein
VELPTLPLSYADCIEILGDPNTCNPRGLSRPVQRSLYLFFEIEDLMELKYLKKKMGQIFFIEGFYIYKVTTSKNYLCNKLKKILYL